MFLELKQYCLVNEPIPSAQLRCDTTISRRICYSDIHNHIYGNNCASLQIIC